MLYDGNIVITDRYILSSLILQRMDGVNADYIMDLNALIIRPDLQVTIMADVGTLQKRLSDRAELTRFERIIDRMKNCIIWKRNRNIEEKWNIGFGNK